MGDFETHKRGAYDEIRASRKLAREIEQATQQFGEGVIPSNVLLAYKELCHLYNKQIQTEEL